jgi:hypothetical protein
MTTIACLIVRSRDMFEWLGHMPMMTWCLNQLHEVRGIDRICCCVVPKLKDRATKLLAKEPVEVVELSAKLKTDRDILAWICGPEGPANTAKVVLLVTPVNPFLPAAKLEACVEAVRDEDYTLAYPAIHQKVLVHDGRGPKASEQHALVSGVTALRLADPGKPATTVVKTIDVSLLESLDITKPDQAHIVQTMVSAGAMV